MARWQRAAALVLGCAHAVAACAPPAARQPVAQAAYYPPASPSASFTPTLGDLPLDESTAPPSSGGSLGGLGSAPPRPAPAPPFSGYHGVVPGSRGMWEGTYHCGQGMQAVSIIVFGNAGAGQGLVEFLPVAGSPYSRHGIYAVSVHEGPGGVLLQPTRWLLRPPGFHTVGFVGTVGDWGQSFSGQVQHPSCGMFALQRNYTISETALQRAEADPQATFAMIEQQYAPRYAQPYTPSPPPGSGAAGSGWNWMEAGRNILLAGVLGLGVYSLFGGFSGQGDAPAAPSSRGGSSRSEDIAQRQQIERERQERAERERREQ